MSLLELKRGQAFQLGNTNEHVLTISVLTDMFQCEVTSLIKSAPGGKVSPVFYTMSCKSHIFIFLYLLLSVM